MSDRYDVIVIGAGHNGLTTAALLARHGRRVLVLERRPIVGGLAAGEEFHPGFRTAGVLSDTSRVRRWVVDALGLRDHGVELRTEEPPSLLAERDGEGILLFRDPERATDELSRKSPSDARRYREYREFLGRVFPPFRRLFDAPPANVFDLDRGDLLRLGRAALSLRLLGKRDMMEVLRITPMCVDDYLDEWFEGDLLKAALAAPGIEGCFAGPRSPGTVANLLWIESSFETAVKGGPRSLIDGLEKAARAAGVEIRCGEAVSEVNFENGVVSGVTLDGGGPLAATAVAASCDPKHLLLDLVPGERLSLAMRSNAAAFRSRGTVAVVDLALSEYPEFTCRPGVRAERVRIGESLDDLERAFDPVKYRRLTPRPVLDIAVPTVESPELAPPGHHVFSVLVHCAPRDLDGGWNEASKDEFFRTVVRTLSEYAPRFERAIVGRRVLTPLDLESTYGVTGGHLFHGEHAIDQLAVRPTPECAGYRTPFPGLFLCGSGSHPGGGITCAPGALAARVILASAD